MRVRLLVLSTFLLLASCNATEDGSPTPTPSPTEVAEQTVDIYLHSGNSEECAEVVAVQRPVEARSLRAAMEQLLAGPTEEEISQGLGGWFSVATESLLISAEIDGDLARVDFEDLRTVIPNASSSCGSAMLLAQLDGTAGQFGVTATLYSIEGDPQVFYEWLQMETPDL